MPAKKPSELFSMEKAFDAAVGKKEKIKKVLDAMVQNTIKSLSEEEHQAIADGAIGLCATQIVYDEEKQRIAVKRVEFNQI